MTTTESTTRTLRLERTFDCSPQRLWNAWTNKASWAKWFGPMDHDNDVQEFDVRPEGRFKMAMNDDQGKKHPIWGEFLVVTRPKELVFVAEANEIAPHVSTVHVRFEAERSKTKLRFAQYGLPSELADDTGQGWEASWDKLDRILGEQKKHKEINR